MSGEPIDLSVVVPVYRTAWALTELVRRVAMAAEVAGLSHELILVDDASPDGAAAAAEELARSHPAIRRLQLPRNRGQHRAVLAGLEQARGRWVAVMDGDLQDPPEALPALVRRGEADARDLVFAARRGRYQSTHRMVTSRVFKGLLAALCGLPRGAGMFFVARHELVRRALQEGQNALGSETLSVVVLIGLAAERVGAITVRREARPHGTSAYSERQRWRAGISTLGFALRALHTRQERRRGGEDGEPFPLPGGRVRELSAVIALGLAAAALVFVAGGPRPFDLSDEGFRYLLSRDWAAGENLFARYRLHYVTGQYAYFGTLIRLASGSLWAVRLGEALLGGLGVGLIAWTVRRVGPWSLVVVAAAAAAFAGAAGYATPASALVFALAVDLALRRRPGPRWVVAASLLAGALAGWREDSAVFAFALAILGVLLRRRPREILTLALPASVVGFVPWLALAALRGEAVDLAAHVGRRLVYLVERLETPQRPGWRFPDQAMESPRALATALFPLLLATPPVLYAGLLLAEARRYLRGRAVRWAVVAACAVGIAYLPHVLWERPDLTHLRAHLHLTVAAVAITAAGLSASTRRRVAAALAGVAILAAAYTAVQARRIEANAYPCCAGRAIGAVLPSPPPPWAGLDGERGAQLIVLGWGPGWYVVEGVRPGTRFLYAALPFLDAEQAEELAEDLRRPGIRWVIRSESRLPPVVEGSLTQRFVERNGWRGWELWERRSSVPKEAE